MPWRYDVVGFLGGDFGLGIAAHNSVRALESSGRSGQAIRVDALPMARDIARAVGLSPGTPPVPIGPPGVAGDDGASDGSVALFQMNPLDVAWHARQWRGLVRSPFAAVSVPFWELPVVPAAWAPVLAVMDAVLAPSRFVQEACAAAVGPDRVLHYPQAVFLPGGVRPDRDAWGIPAGVTAFVVSFDMGSDIERKNPWAAIQAFRDAFAGAADVRLIVKTRPWPDVPAFEAQARALRDVVASDPRIQVVDRSLSYAEVLGLYASCDGMISLHRSEGLGLHLMEAMSLGKVVLATGWSGNLDFMSAGDSVLVPHRLIPVATSHSHYLSEVGRTGQVWADADVGEAARALRDVHAIPDRRHALGAAAALRMEERRREMLSGAAFATLEERLTRPGPAPGPLAPALRRARRAFLGRAARSALVDLKRIALRRVGRN